MEKSCGIVIFSKEEERQYLLLHYESGHWDLAKGHVENSESEEETALRETLEETSLTVEILPGFRETIKYFFRKKDGEIVTKQVVFFVGEAKTKDVKISHEHIGFEWLPYDLALGRLTYKNAKEVLVKADKFLRGRLV